MLDEARLIATFLQTGYLMSINNPNNRLMKSIKKKKLASVESGQLSKIQLLALRGGLDDGQPLVEPPAN